MKKATAKPEKAEGDDEYEIVSFEDFCDKSLNSKTDLLTVNDNINYRLCYENDSNPSESGETSRNIGADLNETSFRNRSDSWSKKGKPFSFSKFSENSTKPSFLSGFIAKTKSEEEDTSEPRYSRFSNHSSAYRRFCQSLPGLGPTILLIAMIIGVSVVVWWAVAGAVGGAWGEEHYRRLWERAHPEEVRHPPHAPPTQDKVYTYHDHNNLSTVNKNKTVLEKNKKSAEETPGGVSGSNLAETAQCGAVSLDARFDCYPQNGASEDACLKRGCCWKPVSSNETGVKLGEYSIGIPYCFYPPNYETFHFLNMTENKHGISVYYGRRSASGYPGDFNFARMDIKYYDNDIVQVKIFDAENRRFEPPLPEIPSSNHGISSKKYRVVVQRTGLGFRIIRDKDNVTIMDTTEGGLILSDKFLQISSLLPTKKIYGLGERRSRFQLDINWRAYTMFNFDTPPVENMNLYGSHPFYLALEDDGNSHGVVLINSNAMDAILQPAPAITYRTIGGIFNFYVMLGPSPAEVVSQYYSLIGYPFLPPYWSLGFHLCKYNYGSLNETEKVWQRTRDAGIPFDVQWNDLDYMDKANDFTYDKEKFAGLPQFIDKLHKAGMKYIILMDPGVSASEPAGQYAPFDNGLKYEVFIKNSTNQPFVGKVWNRRSTVYPDFTNPNVTAYWTELLTDFHKQIPFDGLWIDMNEPSNFLNGPLEGTCVPEDIPYKPYSIGEAGLKTKTVCMDATHYAGSHYDLHNLYSITESVVAKFALTEVSEARPFVLSRSTFVGSGKFVAHWSGDVESSWHDMRMTVPELLNYNLFGIPMSGADICGFRGNTTRELCRRWTQLGALYPFSRNHNSDTSIPQDPVILGPEVVEASITFLGLRYSLITYYYTLMFRAHVYGETVVRPLFFEYPLDQTTHSIDDQFLVGPGIMVAPILEEGKNTTKAYLPGDLPYWAILTEKWVGPGYTVLGENDTVLLVPGNIVPRQQLSRSDRTTRGLRSAPLSLHVCQGGRTSTGTLYWDDGHNSNTYEEKKYTEINFYHRGNTLFSKISWWGYGVQPITEVFVYGVTKPVARVTINNKDCIEKKLCVFKFDSEKKMLAIYDMNVRLDQEFTISWNSKKS